MRNPEATQLKNQEKRRFDMPTDLSGDAVVEISSGLRQLLADVFALYTKTKNFHWHVSGPHFSDYHLLLDEQAAQILATTDLIAERVRTIGAPTLRSIGEISRRQRLRDNEIDDLAAPAMLAELKHDNQQLASCLREAHGLCDEYGDVASALGDRLCARSSHAVASPATSTVARSRRAE